MPMRIVRSVRVRVAYALIAAMHVERHVRHRDRVIGDRLRDPGDDHVRIADRLDLLEAVLLGELVERAEQLVEHRDQLLGAGPRRQRGEPDDVREQHGDRLEPIDDQALAGLEPVGDRRRAAR